MPSSTMTTFRDLSDQIGRGVHNFASHTIRIALSNSTPLVTDTMLSDIAEIAATGGYVAGGYALANVTYIEAAGIATLSHDNHVITATGGSIGPFRHVVYYNDTATSPANALIGWVSYPTPLTLLDTQFLMIGLTTGALKVKS